MKGFRDHPLLTRPSTIPSARRKDQQALAESLHCHRAGEESRAAVARVQPDASHRGDRWRHLSESSDAVQAIIEAAVEARRRRQSAARIMIRSPARSRTDYLKKFTVETAERSSRTEDPRRYLTAR